MTPTGFKTWVKKAATGRKIIYFEGEHLQTVKAKPLRDAAWAAYEKGDVRLFQKRLTPMQGVNAKYTRGTFAYVAVKT
jgi:hypothetical protein